MKRPRGYALPLSGETVVERAERTQVRTKVQQAEAEVGKKSFRSTEHVNQCIKGKVILARLRTKAAVS